MNKPSVGEIAWVVFRDVNRTVGGGIASMELLRRTLAKRGWGGPSEHALLVAVSRLTPGTNILAYCAALGWRTHRWRGSAVALLAASLPAALLVFALAITLVRLDGYRIVQAILGLGMVVAAVLVFSTAWHLIRPYLTGSRRVLACVVTAIAVTLLLMDVSPVRILLVAAIAGAAWPPGADAPAQEPAP